MSHVSRSNRRRNITRRKNAARKQQPLPMPEQLKRAVRNMNWHYIQYPYPPEYKQTNTGV